MKEEEHCGDCRWFRFKEPACTRGWCYVFPDKVERQSYEPICCLYTHKDQHKNEEIKGGCNGLGN